MKVYDATNQILGRMATRITKDLLKGEIVHVINCEKAVLAGNPVYTKKLYSQRINRGDRRYGPFFPKTPQGIVKRAIRGMFPYKKPSGRKAFRKLKIWIGIPEELKENKFIRLKDADVNKLKTKHITIGDLSVYLGNKKRW